MDDMLNSTNDTSSFSDDHNDTPSSQSDPTLQMIRTAAYCFNALLMITGNLINLIVLPKLKNTNEPTKLLLVALAIVDLGTGIERAIFALPSSILDKWPFGRVICIIVGQLSASTVGMSLSVLVLLSLDRYVAITRPFQYLELMTKKRAKIGILSFLIMALSFMYPLGTDEMPMDNVVFFPTRSMCLIDFGNPGIKVWSFALLSTTLSLIFSIAVIYVRILLIARDAVREIAKLQPSVKRNADGSSEEQNASGFSRNEWKATRITLLVTGGISVTWLPFLIGQTWEVSTGNRLPSAADFITLLPSTNS